VAASVRSHVLRFGVFEVDQRARELRKQGIRIRLQEQPFQVLALLLERAGEVVTRDELRQKLWPSSVYVDFDHGLNNAIARLREALGDAASTPHCIETLPRVGYRFIYPLADRPPSTGALAADSAVAGESKFVMPVSPSEGAAVPPRSEQLTTVDDAIPPVEIGRPGVSRWARPRIVSTGAILAALVVLGLLVGPWLARQAPNNAPATPALPKEPSIAVLPFVNITSDPQSEHFADGLSQELVNKLAGISGLKVVGQTSSFYFKGKQELLPVIAQTLKVNYLLEGSVRSSGERLRITAQLIDAAEGSQLWSTTFDRDLTHIFQFQEDIALAVATALSVKLVDADAQRLRKRGTQDAAAYRIYVIANAQLTGVSVKKDVASAKRLFEQAIALDPHFAAAYAGLARYHFHRAWTTLDDVENGVRLGTAAAQRAVSLDPDSSEALQARANFAMWRYRFLDDFQSYTEANGDYRRAIQLDRSNGTVLFDYGRTVLWHEPDLAQDLFERYMRLEPFALPARGMSAVALSLRGLNDAAGKRLQELDERVLNRPGSYAIYAAGLESYLGRLDEAVLHTREALTGGGLELQVWLWGLYMSLGEREAAREALDFGDTGLAGALREAAGLTMHGRYAEALASLDGHRGEFAQSHVLDLPTARLALIAGKPAQALAIIMTQRLPDLFAGVEPVTGQNVIPALDLAAAWAGSGKQAQAHQLLSRIADFLDGPAAPRLPLFIFLRARAHALAGDSELALQTLERAYAAGFRTIWALDLHPQPLLYIDSIEVDPAFAGLRTEPRYQSWLERIKADNFRQLARLRVRAAAKPAV